MMTSLVEREDSQYSYRNTFVAMADNKVVGIAVSYDGGRLHELRQAFIKAAKEYIGKNHSGMDDETQAGELYLDSLAVLPEYRRQGIAQRLLHTTKEKADKMGLPCVGLLVDKGNPAGEALYASVGFQYANDSWWGGHPPAQTLQEYLPGTWVCASAVMKAGGMEYTNGTVPSVYTPESPSFLTSI